MGYAIVGYFDEVTDKKISGLWDQLAIEGIDDYLINSANNPHIKFMMYEDIEKDKLIESISEIAKSRKTIDVIFKSYSFYPNERPFFNIDMAVSEELLALQETIRESCDKLSHEFQIDFFDKGIWKPDCQLTREIDISKMFDAVGCLYKNKLPLVGKIEKIGLIEFHPAKQIIHFNLLQ